MIVEIPLYDVALMGKVHYVCLPYREGKKMQCEKCSLFLNPDCELLRCKKLSRKDKKNVYFKRIRVEEVDNRRLYYS